MRPSDELRELVVELLEHYDDGRRTAPLLSRLRELSLPGRAAPRDGTTATGKPSSRAPVAGPWWIVTELEAGVRDLEAEAREALGFLPRARPATAPHAVDALATLPDLVAALPADHYLAGDALREVRRWHRRIREHTGLAERWARVRHFYDPDAGELVTAACPYCHAASLRRRPTDAAVVCCAPECATPDGGRPEWGVDELVRLGLVLRS